MNKIIIVLTLILGLSGNAVAQSKQQIQEISQLKSRIKNANEQIAEDYAYMSVYNFFDSRFNFIHQANGRCIELVEKVKVEIDNLSKPELLKSTYDPAQSFALVEAITNDIIYDQTVYKNLKSLEEEFKLQQFQINDTLTFLNSTDAAIIQRFPRPNDLRYDNGYKANLLKAYREVAAQSDEKMRYYASKCTGSNLGLSPVIDQRRVFYTNLLKTVGDFYVENITEQYIENIKSLAKPSYEINTMLNIESALSGLDRQYREAALYENDYLKSVSIIDSYETIATAILAQILPLTLDDNLRAQATSEVQRRITRAHDYKKILDKRTPSIWLENRLSGYQKKIDAKVIDCNAVCAKKMSEVKDLIAAAKIMELVSKDQIYVVLGNQLLDNLK